MNFKNIVLKESYETGQDDLISSFYEPMMLSSIKYDRIAGFFTSTSFAISAKGIYNIIENNGIVRMLVSPKLSKDDILAIEKAGNTDEIIVDNFNREMLLDQDKIMTNYHKILSWLVKNGHLTIKIVLVKNNSNQYLTGSEIEKMGIFHQKIGIFYDKFDNVVSFSGSINETFSAWMDNIEEFKVFKSWDDTQNKYCQSDLKKFNEYWNGLRGNVEIKDLPDAIKEKIVEYAPDDSNILKKHIQNIKSEKQVKHNEISLFLYQKEALEKWLKNNKVMLFEMATGTGKTRTALACIENSIRKCNKKIVIISTPQSTLSIQWKNEVNRLLNVFDDELICDGTTNWRSILEKHLLNIYHGLKVNLIIYTTHETASSDDFITIIDKHLPKTHDVIFVADEVHGIGSEKRKKALRDAYKERIGLSATPSRWFDDLGTKFIVDYFNNNYFEFTIADALATINPITGRSVLSNYIYKPEFVQLTQEESYAYEILTDKINKQYYIKKNDDDSFLSKLAMDRANIIKNAENKLGALEKLILAMKPETIKNTIIFVSDEQLEKTISLLKKHEIQCHKYTMIEGRSPKKEYFGKSEREYIIDLFKQGTIKVLVAIRCLDEGIDIPSADTAILVSSTTNPREYIQRIGRVIRQYENKSYAKIFDMVVKTKAKTDYDKKIIDKEMTRIFEIARHSTNNAEVLAEIKKEFGG